MQRLIRSFNTLTDTLKETLQEQYPDGIDSTHIKTIPTAKGDILRVIELRPLAMTWMKPARSVATTTARKAMTMPRRTMRTRIPMRMTLPMTAATMMRTDRSIHPWLLITRQRP
jgi:hypothetical protein